MNISQCCRLLSTIALLADAASGNDWPQILGPHRNGVYEGQDLAATWPKEGPPLRWQKKIGAGFSGPAVMAGKLILFHRPGDRETVECLSVTDEKQLWSFDYPATYRDDFGFDNGPRAVPTIADGKVYTFGADGVLHCLDLATGKKVWMVEVRKEFQAPKGFFGFACSPLVEGHNVLLNIGGKDGAGIVAFDGPTGKVAWKTTTGEASYSSPVSAMAEGRRYALFFARSGLVGVNPTNGRVALEIPWRAQIRESVNAATPLVVGNLIFISTSYQTGALLLRLQGDNVQRVWSGDEVLSNHYATSVHLGGFLYGLDGRHDFPPGPELRCVELATGKVRWRRENLGPANVLLAGNQLLVLTERGELLRFAADPSGCQETGRAQILGAGVRAYPALANGMFFARDKNRLVCVDLKP